jgi:hypothetical protein
MSITFSSCFYVIKSKFETVIYIEWMKNFLSIVNNFNLVIYTDENSATFIPEESKNNDKIKIIIKSIEEFYNYKYKDYWIENHNKNMLLNDKSTWELNMLWCEKVWFVKETIERNYFETEFYGWCDIGYFRNRLNDLNTSFLSNWSSPYKILKLDKNKIYYACVNNDIRYMNFIYKIVNCKNKNGVPVIPIPPNQFSVAGGFFILHKNNIDFWSKTFDTKLELYFKNNYLVKDDQIILIDCILSDPEKFVLFRETNQYDNWFMFQRILI